MRSKMGVSTMPMKNPNRPKDMQTHKNKKLVDEQ